MAYGDFSAFGPWVFWYFRMFGHGDVRVMNGGRKKWLDEGRPLSTETPTVPATAYVAQAQTSLLVHCRACPCRDRIDRYRTD